MLLSVGLIGAQTVITPPANRYSPSQDVELGRQAAAQVEQQLPILRDEDVTSPVASIGRRLVDAIPPESPASRVPLLVRGGQRARDQRVRAARRTDVHQSRDDPGGAQRRRSCRRDGPRAESRRAAARHGASDQGHEVQIGELAGAVIGAIIGGRVGGAVSQGTQFGLGTAFLRFSREYERQADLLGSHIMARAGYDPRDMANMFKTIEKEDGPGGPAVAERSPGPREPLRGHHARSAVCSRCRTRCHDARAFEQVQARLRRMAPAPTTEEASAQRGGSRLTSPRLTCAPSLVALAAWPGPRHATPRIPKGTCFASASRRTGASCRATTPSPSRRTGAYGTAGGQSVFTHGVQIGLVRNETHDLRTATGELIDSLARGNPNLSRPSRYDNASIGGRRGLHTVLSNVSDATGQQERIEVFTTLVGDGSLFYALGVAPRDRFSDYEGTFRRVVGSIQIMD